MAALSAAYTYIYKHISRYVYIYIYIYLSTEDVLFAFLVVALDGLELTLVFVGQGNLEPLAHRALHPFL